MQFGKRSRPDSYDDIEYYHASKKFKYNDGSSCRIWSYYKVHSDVNESENKNYTASMPANTRKCDATTDEGNLLTATSVSTGSNQ